MSFTNEDWFVIKDLEGFIYHTRVITFNSYGKRNENQENDTTIHDMLDISVQDKEELDDILSYDEAATIIKSMLKKQKSKKTKELRYLLNDELYIDIVQSLGDRMTSNILQNLVKKGLVETGYDSESNDFIFWIKDEEEQQ